MSPTREQLRAVGWTDAQIDACFFDSQVQDQELTNAVHEKHHANYELSLLAIELREEKRARNMFATLALVGWIVALAALGGVV